MNLVETSAFKPSINVFCKAEAVFFSMESSRHPVALFPRNPASIGAESDRKSVTFNIKVTDLDLPLYTYMMSGKCCASRIRQLTHLQLLIL